MLDPLLQRKACKCATTSRKWANCSDMRKGPDDEFLLVRCGCEVDIHVGVGRQVQRGQPSNLAATQVSFRRGTVPPNVLILQLDSVSRAYAQRHLPRTWAFLTGLSETAGAVMNLDLFTVLGSNSLSNQYPLLTGCLFQPDWMYGVERMYHATPWALGFGRKAVWCRKSGCLWCAASRDAETSLFHLAKRHGHRTLFGQEFCSRGGRFNLLGSFETELNATLDHVFDDLYCRLAHGNYGHDWGGGRSRRKLLAIVESCGNISCCGRSRASGTHTRICRSLRSSTYWLPMTIRRNFRAWCLSLRNSTCIWRAS